LSGELGSDAFVGVVGLTVEVEAAEVKVFEISVGRFNFILTGS
jgi:hypothetical protein